MHSTIYIEGVWGTVKNYIKKMHNSIPDENFILFLREGEFRYIMGKLDINEKEKKNYRKF